MSKNIIDPCKFISKIKSKFDKSDLMVAIIVLVLGFINNFYFLIGDGVAPDALSPSYFNIAGDWESQLGRFLIRYVNYMRYGLVNKLIIVLISLVCIAISVMLLKRLFMIKSRLGLFLLACVLCIAPQFTETYMFIYCADAYLIAFTLAISSVYLINKTDNKKIYYLLSIICVAIVCALYQAYLGVVLGLTIILLINKIITNEITVKEVIKKFFVYMITFLIGVIGYYVCLKLLLKVQGLELVSYKGANSLGINTILDLPKTILNCYKDFCHFFMTNRIINNSYYHRSIIYGVIGLFTLIGMIECLIKIKDNKIAKWLVLILLGVIYPICISVMNIIASTTRINLVTGPGILITILFPILVFENSFDNNISNIKKWGITLGCFALILSFIVENAFTYMVREQTFNNYKVASIDIYSKVTSIDEYNEDIPWMFSDVIRFKPIDSEKANGFISNDNVTWDNYIGTFQNRDFYQKYMGVNINIVDKSIYDKIKKSNEFKSMPIYPEKGSIKIIDDVIVIKVSDKTY